MAVSASNGPPEPEWEECSRCCDWARGGEDGHLTPEGEFLCDACAEAAACATADALGIGGVDADAEANGPRGELPGPCWHAIGALTEAQDAERNDACRVDGCSAPSRRSGLCYGHKKQRDLGRPFSAIARFASVRERYWSTVEKDGPPSVVAPSLGRCWMWTGYIQPDGYGVFQGGGRATMAHRWAYEDMIGPITAGLTLDHLCRVRACVNPAHLEPVTNKDNILRGTSPSAMNAVKTHCPRGHELSDDNLIRSALPDRECRTCYRARDKARIPRSRRMARSGGEGPAC